MNYAEAIRAALIHRANGNTEQAFGMLSAWAAMLLGEDGEEYQTLAKAKLLQYVDEGRKNG